MPSVVLEIELAGEWRHVGAMNPPDQSGSMSSLEEAGRQMFLFGWIDGRPGVWRSRGGYDIEYGPLREVTAVDGLEQLAELTPDRPALELMLTGAMGIARRHRIRLDA